MAKELRRAVYRHHERAYYLLSVDAGKTITKKRRKRHRQPCITQQITHHRNTTGTYTHTHLELKRGDVRDKESLSIPEQVYLKRKCELMQ